MNILHYRSGYDVSIYDTKSPKMSSKHDIIIQYLDVIVVEMLREVDNFRSTEPHSRVIDPQNLNAGLRERRKTILAVDFFSVLDSIPRP
jgi:hypothetical protein